jgi:hypothetical protein
MYLISSIQSSGFFVQGSGFSNYDDLVESHEFNYRWLSKKVHIPPPNLGGIKRRIIFSGTRPYMSYAECLKKYYNAVDGTFYNAINL